MGEVYLGTHGKGGRPVATGGGWLAALSGRIMLLHGWRRALVAFAAGAVGAFAHAPYDFFAAGLIAFPLFVWLLDGAAADSASGRLRRARAFFTVGWWFGFGWFLSGLWWVGNAMLTDLEKYAWALPIGVLILPAGMALFYGLAAALARPLWNEGLGRLFALSAAFGVLEWLRGWILTGFPWNAVGAAVMPTPMLMQSLGIVGMMGVNVLAVLWFSLPAQLAAPRRRRLALVLLVLLAAAHAGFGAARLWLDRPADAPELAVRIVQPSIDQSRKWSRDQADSIFSTYLKFSAAPPRTGAPVPVLILWPETSLPFILSQRPDAVGALSDMLKPDQTLLAGAVRLEGQGGADTGSRYYNSVIAVNDEGVQFDAVDKNFLVPLGEFVPFEPILSRIGIRKLVQLPGGFTAGTSRHAIELPGGTKIVPYICYEVLFPGVAIDETKDADLIVNVTNDAWFGDSPGPYQHLRLAQFRAVEAGRPLVRAANNGISAIVDAHGRVLDALSLDGIGTLDAQLKLVRADNLRLPFAPLVGWAILCTLMMLGALAKIVSMRNV